MLISERQNREKITTRQRRIKKPKKSTVDNVTIVLSPSSSSIPVNNEDDEDEEDEGDDEENDRDNEINTLALTEADSETKEAVQVSCGLLFYLCIKVELMLASI